MQCGKSAELVAHNRRIESGLPLVWPGSRTAVWRPASHAVSFPPSPFPSRSQLISVCTQKPFSPCGRPAIHGPHRSGHQRSAQPGAVLEHASPGIAGSRCFKLSGEPRDYHAKRPTLFRPKGMVVAIFVWPVVGKRSIPRLLTAVSVFYSGAVGVQFHGSSAS